MSHIKIISGKEPIRLFKSDFLEAFTHISPITIIVIWLPVVLICLGIAIANRSAFASPFEIPLALLLGVVVWTPTEYIMHRFVFHFPPRTPWLERTLFLFHGVHHAQPGVKTRLVMPPPVSIPLALIFYVLFSLVAGGLLAAPHWVAPLFSGFISGYLIYDLTHYATHHIPMKPRALMWLKRYHMLHHAKTPGMRYGVSSPLWDMVFGTYKPVGEK